MSSIHPASCLFFFKPFIRVIQINCVFYGFSMSDSTRTMSREFLRESRSLKESFSIINSNLVWTPLPVFGHCHPQIWCKKCPEIKWDNRKNEKCCFSPDTIVRGHQLDIFPNSHNILWSISPVARCNSLLLGWLAPHVVQSAPVVWRVACIRPENELVVVRLIAIRFVCDISGWCPKMEDCCQQSITIFRLT